MTDTRTERMPLSRARLVPATSILLLSLASLVWIARDRTVWPWDQAWYGQTALDLWAARPQTWDLVHWLWAMLNAMGSKPPLLPWLAQFLVPLSRFTGGRMEPALLLGNVVCQGAIFILLFRLGKRIGCRTIEALAGALIGTGGSLTIGLTDQFLVEPLLEAACVLLMCEAWTAGKADGLRLSAGLVVTTALGFLTKASAFTFVVPYLVYVAVARLATRGAPRQARGLTYPWLALAGIAGFACVAWYVVNWASMRQHFIDATSNQVALLYGSVGSLSTKLSFWSRSAAIGLSPWPWLALLPAMLVLLGLASLIPNFLRLRPLAALGEATRSGWLFAGASAGLVVVTVVGLSFQIEEETRFIVTIYAPLGIATAWALAALGRRWLSVATAGVFALNTLWNIGISEGVWGAPQSTSVWLKPYDADAHNMARLRSVVAATCPPDHDPNFRVIGNEYPSFNANSAAFYAAIQRRGERTTCPYTSLGFAEKDARRALAGLDELPAQEVIFIAPARQPPADAFNAVSLAVLESLRSNPEFDLKIADNGEVWIFNRRDNGPTGRPGKP